MRRHGRAAWAVAVTILVLATPTAGQTSDELAVHEIVDGLPAAWNAGDADAWVERFEESSTFTNILGMHFEGREANRQRHASLFETVFLGSELTAELLDLHFVGPLAAVVQVGLELRGYQGLPPGITPTQPGVLRTRLILALRKRDDGWWVVAAQNTAVLPPP